eukprot:m.23300 g.23300  ORF g.23300 m.23300 type:complete len:247 (+) comp11363_c0_seq2:115-855(+)
MSQDSRTAQTPRLGVTRPTMRNNILLAKPSLGQTLQLPPSHVEGIRHGIKSGRSLGVASAMSWQQPPSQAKAVSRRKQKHIDFIQMNKTALHHGLTTAKDQQTLLQSSMNFDRPSKPSRSRRRTASAPSSRRPAGLASGQSEALAEIISGQPGRDWRTAHHSQQLYQQSAHSQHPIGVTMTKTAILRQKYPKAPAEPLWKLKKFQAAQPAISTFRSPQARNRAQERHKLDSTDRVGVFGHGLHSSL